MPKFMGTVFLIVAGLAIVLLNGHAQQQPESRQQQHPTQIGHYQIIQASYTATVGAGFEVKAVFKIDTTTGQTWEHRAGSSRDGKPYQYWYPIPNSN